ncbi:MAG: 2-oxoglutarate dehydrogenase, E2 component, dihydrolipoamide succinyltransferase [Actinobacteria bacterium]|nr:2-oxoglutarate dehydrogenase, E2 component, dihydrolipoamide succinyltransferase [Actinomycetota bacterium]
MASITMPQPGETITEGTVAKWMKHEGEHVEKDESVVEISTDKVDIEVPSPASGTVSRIVVQEGDTVPVGSELAVVEETVAEEKLVPPAEAKPEAAVKPPTPPGARPVERPHEEAKPPGRPVGPPTGLPEAPLGFISPVVRRLAVEKGVDLSQIKGTGSGGRISKKDVLAAAEAAAVPAPAPALPAAPPAAPKAAPPPGAGEEVVKLTMIRKTIAENMLKSSQSTAHVTAIVEVEMENIAAQRSRFKDEFKRREGFSLTYLPFVARAVIEALLEFPKFNSELDGDNLILKRYVNLAISVDRPDGLVAPVIKGAEGMNLPGVARAVNNIAARARRGELHADETRGGTFTITNPGSIGSIIQTPIINPPQVAILSLEKIEKRVVPIDGGIGIRSMVYMPLTYDHRVVDGADAARFLMRVKENLETWSFTTELAKYGRGAIEKAA